MNCGFFLLLKAIFNYLFTVQTSRHFQLSSWINYKTSHLILVLGADNAPTVDNFKCVQTVPPPEPADGMVTIQTLYLSLDPAMVNA